MHHIRKLADLNKEVVSLDSVDEIRTTRAYSLSTPDARDTIHLRIALWNVPPAPVVRGRRPAVRASKSRNTLARCGPWQKVIRFPEPQRSQGAGSPKQWQPGPACHGSRDDLIIPLCSMSPKFLNLLKRGHENASQGSLANPPPASTCA